MIISSIHDTDMQLKYDQVKKVKNRPEFYKEESGRVIFPFFFLLDQGQKLNQVWFVSRKVQRLA